MYLLLILTSIFGTVLFTNCIYQRGTKVILSSYEREMGHNELKFFLKEHIIWYFNLKGLILIVTNSRPLWIPSKKADALKFIYSENFFLDLPIIQLFFALLSKWFQKRLGDFFPNFWALSKYMNLKMIVLLQKGF